MTTKEALPDTRSRLAEAFETRGKAIADQARIQEAIAGLKRSGSPKHERLRELNEQYGNAAADLELGTGTQEAVDAIEKERTAVAGELKNTIETIRALERKSEVAQEVVKDAKLALARELEGIAWPVFDEISREAVDHFTRFLDAVRRRCQLAATVTEAYRTAGEMREPMDESSVERAKFLGEFNLNGEGLADLLPQYSLKLSSGLGFLPTGSLQLTESALLALAEAATE